MSRVPAVLVMHADLSAALLRAAEQVTGPIEGVDSLSNTGLSRAELEREIACSRSSRERPSLESTSTPSTDP